MLTQGKLLSVRSLFRMDFCGESVRQFNKCGMPIGIVLSALIVQVIVAAQIEHQLVDADRAAKINRVGQILMHGAAPGMVRIVPVPSIALRA